MLKDRFSSEDYDDLTLAERMEAIVEAREMARDDIEQNRDTLNPFALNDPHRDSYDGERKAYLAERKGR